MKPDEDPRVVDLHRYRREARAKARRGPPPPPRPRSEPILGGRPRAGLILAVVALALLAVWLLPSLARLPG